MNIPSGFGHIVHLFTGDAVPNGASVTYGIDTDGAGDPNVIAALAHGCMGNSFVSLMGPSTALVETLVRIGPSPDGPVGNHIATVLGGNTGSQVTPQVAVLVRKRTNLGGKRHRGRFYLPGLIEGGVNERGEVSSATQTAFQTQAAEMLAALITAGIPMVILHNGITAPTPVTELIVDSRVATQRRRLRR
jgi:hypothetical protein